MQKAELANICTTCKFSLPFVYRGRRISEAEIEELRKSKKTSWQKGWSKKDSKGKLDGRLVISEGKISFEAKILAAKCPKCQSLIYKDGDTWACGGQNCGFEIRHTLFGRKFSEDELAKLLTFGYSDNFCDFVSQKGKFYSGFLEFDENSDLKMRFLP